MHVNPWIGTMIYVRASDLPVSALPVSAAQVANCQEKTEVVYMSMTACWHDDIGCMLAHRQATYEYLAGRDSHGPPVASTYVLVFWRWAREGDTQQLEWMQTTSFKSTRIISYVRETL